MQTLYINNLEKENARNILEKIFLWYKKTFNIFDIKNIDNMVICNIPSILNIREKKMEKISKKICKKFFTDFQLKKNKNRIIEISKLNKKYFINKIVLSKQLEDNKILKSYISKYNVEILNGRWLFKYLTIKILEYISKKQNISLEEKNVAILINNNIDINLNLIKLIATKVKRLSIITSNISKFKYIEEKLYDEYGIAIEVSNNKRKSLLKTDIIINIDFEEEILNRYKINNTAIIINMNEKIKINSRSFNGININYYNIRYKNIEIFNENKMNKYFDTNILYESYIYRKDNLYNILEQINKDKVEIAELIGDNGKINCEEFTVKTLDKFEKLS